MLTLLCLVGVGVILATLWCAYETRRVHQAIDRYGEAIKSWTAMLREWQSPEDKEHP